MNKPFDTGELRIFLYDEDRTIIPFFSGREDLQTRIEKSSEVISHKLITQSPGEPAAGMTQLIQGAPGIGKTSLLEKIKLNCIEQLNNESDDHKTIPVMINDPGYLSFDYLSQRIHDTIEELDDEISVAKTKDAIRSSLGAVSSVSAFGFGIGLENRSKTKPIVPKNHTILLMIDEVQTIPAEKNTDVSKVLLRLHGGSNGYPILPVLAGLSNSTRVLQQIGIYRFGTDAEHQLQPLKLPEVKESIGKFMDHFNVRTTSKLTSEWGDRIGGWVDGWPKHVENSMRSLGEELLLTGGDLSAVDPHNVKLRATQRRVAYYNTRFGSFDTIPKIVGEVMADIGSMPRQRHEIEEIILQTLAKPLWAQLTSGTYLPKLDFEFLLRHGQIDRIKRDPAIFKCPIPSLQSFAVARTGSPLHISAYAGDLESLGKDLATGYEINGVDAWGRTPLHLAAEYDWEETARILLAKGADPKLRDKQERLPLDMAMEGSKTRGLLNRVTNPSPSPGNSRDYDYDPSPDF